MMPLILAIISFDSKHPASIALLQGVHCLWRYIIVERLFRNTEKIRTTLGDNILPTASVSHTTLLRLAQLKNFLFPDPFVKSKMRTLTKKYQIYLIWIVFANRFTKNRICQDVLAIVYKIFTQKVVHHVDNLFRK